MIDARELQRPREHFCGPYLTSSLCSEVCQNNGDGTETIYPHAGRPYTKKITRAAEMLVFRSWRIRRLMEEVESGEYEGKARQLLYEVQHSAYDADDTTENERAWLAETTEKMAPLAEQERIQEEFEIEARKARRAGIDEYFERRRRHGK